MNSSIFISDAAGEPALWRRLIGVYAATCAVIGLLAATLLLALDPYDTGRFALFGAHGVPNFGQRFRVASIARQPELDVAIIGNSTIQLIDPVRLGALSGKRVVTLAVPGTGPLEQDAVVTWLSAHHRDRALHALVLGIDDSWCRDDGKLAPLNPFPFWLYTSDPIVYAANMLRLKSFEAAGRKVQLMLGAAAATRADGYDDYDVGRDWDRAAVAARLREDAEPVPLAAAGQADFAGLRLLESLLARLPRETTMVFVVPPRYRGAVVEAHAGPDRARACKKELMRLVAQRQRARLLDLSRRSDLIKNAEDYWDPLHYRAPVARAIEVEIAAALAEANG